MSSNITSTQTVKTEPFLTTYNNMYVTLQRHLWFLKITVMIVMKDGYCRFKLSFSSLFLLFSAGDDAIFDHTQRYSDV